MNSLIEVFRMSEISEKTRARVIIQLGRAINAQYAMNITEPLVYELVSILDPQHPILHDEDFLFIVSPIGVSESVKHNGVEPTESGDTHA